MQREFTETFSIIRQLSDKGFGYRLCYSREADGKDSQALSQPMHSREEAQTALAFVLLLSNIQEGLRPLVTLHGDDCQLSLLSALEGIIRVTDLGEDSKECYFGSDFEAPFEAARKAVARAKQS